MTAITLSQAMAAQAEEYPSWENMSDVEQLHSIWWDAYKDAYGFRPRTIEVGHWTAEMFRSDLEFLGKEIERQEQNRRDEEALAVERFSKRVQEVIESGAGDRETALRWIMEADDCRGDWEYLCYQNGLPYGFFKKLEA